MVQWAINFIRELSSWWQWEQWQQSSKGHLICHWFYFKLSILIGKHFKGKCFFNTPLVEDSVQTCISCINPDIPNTCTTVPILVSLFFLKKGEVNIPISPLKFFWMGPVNDFFLTASLIMFLIQGYGRSLWLMHGFYRANGGCGYVKKPDFLMKNGPNDEVFNPKAELPVKTTLKVLLSLMCLLFISLRWPFIAKSATFNEYCTG